LNPAPNTVYSSVPGPGGYQYRPAPSMVIRATVLARETGAGGNENVLLPEPYSPGEHTPSAEPIGTGSAAAAEDAHGSEIVPRTAASAASRRWSKAEDMLPASARLATGLSLDTFQARITTPTLVTTAERPDRRAHVRGDPRGRPLPVPRTAFPSRARSSTSLPADPATAEAIRSSSDDGPAHHRTTSWKVTGPPEPRSEVLERPGEGQLCVWCPRSDDGWGEALKASPGASMGPGDPAGRRR
jgi:hypothetical protein